MYLIFRWFATTQRSPRPQIKQRAGPEESKLDRSFEPSDQAGCGRELPGHLDSLMAGDIVDLLAVDGSLSFVEQD